MDFLMYLTSSLIILILFFLVANKKITKKDIPLLKWLLELIIFSFNYWTNSKKYDSYLQPFSMFIENIEKVNSDKLLSSAEKEILTKSLSTIQDNFVRYNDPQDIKFFMGGLTLLLNNTELREGLLSFKSSQSIEVRKLTLLTIDVVGVIVELKSELDQEYFQHVVYGINKTLLHLRDGGYKEKSLEEAAATLFRVYQLTRAYLHLKGNKSLTKEEFNAKFKNLFSQFLNVFFS